MSLIERWKTQTAYECPECGALHADSSGECHLECGDELREVSTVAEHHLQGAVAALRKFAVSDSEFVDDYEGGEPSDDIQVCVGITRAEAAAIRAIVGGQ